MLTTPPGTPRSRLATLLRSRPLWPAPGLLLLLLTLAWLPEAAWQPHFVPRRTLSDAELGLAITGSGCLAYWLLLLLEQTGLLHSSRSWGMREPSEAELTIAAAGVRCLCLAMVYAGPLLLWGRD